MKTFTVIAAIILMSIGTVRADDVPLKWDKVNDSRCAGYAIEMTADYQNWVEVWSTGDPNVLTATIQDIQGNTLVHFRVASIAIDGKRYPHPYAGAWYDGSKKPVSYPPGAGVAE